MNNAMTQHQLNTFLHIVVVLWILAAIATFGLWHQHHFLQPRTCFVSYMCEAANKGGGVVTGYCEISIMPTATHGDVVASVKNYVSDRQAKAGKPPLNIDQLVILSIAAAPWKGNT